MAGIIKTSINLSAIPKDKIIEGKKGKYLPITITVNDEIDHKNSISHIRIINLISNRDPSFYKSSFKSIIIIAA